MRRLLPPSHFLEAVEMTGTKGDSILQTLGAETSYSDLTQLTIFVEGEAEVWKRKPLEGDLAETPLVRKPGSTSFENDKYTHHAPGTYELICTSPRLLYYCIRSKNGSFTEKQAIRLKVNSKYTLQKGMTAFIAKGSFKLNDKRLTAPHLLQAVTDDIVIIAVNQILGVAVKVDVA